MENAHDDIVEKSAQGKTYERITVSLFEKIDETPSTGVIGELESCNVIRIAEWSVTRSDQPCGEKAQFNTRNKVLEDSSGIPAGLVCKGIDDKDACLTVTIWEKDASRQRYAKHEPIERGVVKDFDIVIDHAWTVMNGRT